jgi:hypothetical protein
VSPEQISCEEELEAHQLVYCEGLHRTQSFNQMSKTADEEKWKRTCALGVARRS